MASAGSWAKVMRDVPWRLFSPKEETNSGRSRAGQCVQPNGDRMKRASRSIRRDRQVREFEKRDLGQDIAQSRSVVVRSRKRIIEQEVLEIAGSSSEPVPRELVQPGKRRVLFASLISVREAWLSALL